MQLVQAFEKANGLKLPCEIAARRPGDIAESYDDQSKAAREQGWKARRDQVQMSRDAWRFEQGAEI